MLKVTGLPPFVASKEKPTVITSSRVSVSGSENTDVWKSYSPPLPTETDGVAFDSGSPLG